MILASLTYYDVALRFAFATAAGAVVGFEREMRGRPAGLRTTILTSIAAAASIILAEALFGDPIDSVAAHQDAISRVIQGVLTGIGFLGAGAITREARVVYGLTTAAVLWAVTILGMLFGAGHWALGTGGLALMMGVLVGLRFIEVYLPRDRFGYLTVTVHLSGTTDAELRDRVHATGMTTRHFSLEYDLENKQRTLRCDVRYRRREAFDAVEQAVTELSRCRGVISVNWTSG